MRDHFTLAFAKLKLIEGGGKGFGDRQGRHADFDLRGQADLIGLQLVPVQSVL